MKKFLPFLFTFYLLLFIISSCQQEKDKFRWLEGTWKVKTDSDTGSVFHEKWWWDNNTNIIRGKGFEVLREDTSWFETLSIEKIKNQWYYRAHVPSEHGSDTINFILLSDPDSDSLSFQNDENDFPGAIRYIKRAAEKITIILETSPHAEPQAKYVLEMERVG